MQVILYNFSKRENSTKTPLENDVTKKQLNKVYLKENTSFINPVLLFSPDFTGTQFNPVQYNYIFVPLWERYYFIRDWVYLNSVWECQLAIDVLGSFKSAIGDTSAYIERSNTSYDTNIIDTFYPAKSNVHIEKVNVSSSYYNIAPSGGTYVLGTINYDQYGKFGAVTYYALTQPLFNTVLNYLFQDNIFQAEQIDDISEGLFKSMFNPFQYIVSCIWFPFDITSFGSQAKPVKVGYWDIPNTSTAVYVSNFAQTTYITATITDHPQASARGAYLNRSPYTKLTLFIPPFGCIPIDTNFLTIGKYLYSEVVVDHITGQATIRISISQDSNNLDKYNIMTERSGMMGVPIQIAQAMPDYLGTATSITSGIGSVFSGNIGGAVSSVLSAVSSQMPKVSTTGANGSMITTLLYPVLIEEHLLLADENRTEFGRPLNQTKTISTLSGFVKCANNDYPFSCTETERKMINKYLSDGFFYE